MKPDTKSKTGMRERNRPFKIYMEATTVHDKASVTIVVGKNAMGTQGLIHRELELVKKIIEEYTSQSWDQIIPTRKEWHSYVFDTLARVLPDKDGIRAEDAWTGKDTDLITVYTGVSPLMHGISNLYCINLDKKKIMMTGPFHYKHIDDISEFPELPYKWDGTSMTILFQELETCIEQARHMETVQNLGWAANPETKTGYQVDPCAPILLEGEETTPIPAYELKISMGWKSYGREIGMYVKTESTDINHETINEQENYHKATSPHFKYEDPNNWIGVNAILHGSEMDRRAQNMYILLTVADSSKSFCNDINSVWIHIRGGGKEWHIETDTRQGVGKKTLLAAILRRTENNEWIVKNTNVFWPKAIHFS